MQTKKSHWLRFCWNIGRTAFVGGWTIFLSWVISRYFFAEDFFVLALIGFFWLLGFFVVCTFAMFLLGIYVFINRRQLHREVFFTSLMLLINLPSCYFILEWHNQIEKMIFVKVINQSGKGQLKLKLIGPNYSNTLGELDLAESKVFHYVPPFKTADARFYPDSLQCIIKYGEKTDTIDFPKYSLGTCQTLVIGPSFVFEK